jgi:GNAT superfamily N-acetyltransferase
MNIITLTDADGGIIEPDWLARAERVHRQLRPALPVNYRRKLEQVFAGGGRMCIAVASNRVLGVAIYRIYENTSAGLQLYVDDLITDEDERSRGVGNALMTHLETLARQAGCETFALDSGTHRPQAHRFYFREGMFISSFHFKKALR